MVITYPAGESNMFTDLRERITRVTGNRTGLAVCDIGGGAHPFYSPAEITSAQFDYTVLDISQDELAAAPEDLRKIQCDIGGSLNRAIDFPFGKPMDLTGKFDIVFSVMTAEHIRNAEEFHRNTLQMLIPGGAALHLFPTLYTVPFIINKFLPETFSRIVNKNFSPELRHTREKFHAYYHWCRGPLRSAIRRYERIGAEVVEYGGYFAHGYYNRFPFLNRLHRWRMNFLERHPAPLFTNYAFVWYRKPLVYPNTK